MIHVADHDSAKALALLNRYYSEGKDMAALVDELACLTRDLMILKTAPKEGISMLSGVASEEEVKMLAGRFSTGELVRMMNLIQQTASGFVRSASRRLDVELCLVNLCQPELSMDSDALNSRLTRIEEQLRSGIVSVAAEPRMLAEAEEELPPAPNDQDALVESVVEQPPIEQAPIGFWTDLVGQIRRELNPTLLGFFVTTPNAPVQGVLRDGSIVLQCGSKYIFDSVNKPEVLDLVARKASAALGRPVRAVPVDRTAKPVNSQQMEQLLAFGRANSDRINIKE